MNQLPIQEFVSALKDSISNNTFISLSLGNYKGTEEHLKNIYGKKILVKREEKLSLTYRFKTRDIVKNFPIEETEKIITKKLDEGFLVAGLFTTEYDWNLDINHKGKATLKKKEAKSKTLPPSGHDKEKNRQISPKDKGYLTALKITDEDGNVFKNAQDKYKQINHYVDILSPLIREIPETDKLKVVDMGSGKGYLTFALYDYLSNVVNRPSQITGVEFREDLVELCNKISDQSGFQGLDFVEGTIEDYQTEAVNILIALHACDTATDDAISKGIKANADLIVVAPCCHKQIRREIEKNKASNDVDFLTRHGIFLERQAEMVTDGIRALVLEYFGYKTKVFEFISDAHTPKNVMIVGTKGSKADKNVILQKIKHAKSYFGIEKHHLEKVLDL
ncbi:SAM-dependent methyltransferase [Dyadobacter sp. CY312]|uniref:class I SAM-dependent methyltransferase n=1 Tax=Dyadobacter sp. CY312 TaxID=2907303 RepID=UPI001F48966F|nr:SAM-dependent methyltransferase [Dyadobacter sp. CY312]MCE7038878.1 SAM-dependent methyltransferase [Dyadobacter sp. CY312]